MSDINCPYCNIGVNIIHDDGYGYREATFYQQPCWACDKTFVYQTTISYCYESSKADCLNGGDHTWKPTKTIPVEYTMMVCTQCDGARRATQEEMEAITGQNIN